MIKQLLNSVIAKNGDLSVSRRSIIYLSLRQIIDLHATDKSQYFAPTSSNTCYLNAGRRPGRYSFSRLLKF